MVVPAYPWAAIVLAVQPPRLLNDDGSASMATLLMMSHHGFRRDLGMFARIGQAAPGALAAEWRSLHEKLHGHHQMEDQNIFPALQQQKPEISAVIERLGADHRRIDPLLQRGDRAFASHDAADAADVVTQLLALLGPHLATEEEELVPMLRLAKGFPAPSEAEADLFAQGFAWSSFGVAAEVLAAVDEMLPEILRVRLPAARAGFADDFRRLWGAVTPGASRTPIPDWLPPA